MPKRMPRDPLVVYRYDELSSNAKDKATSTFIESNLSYDWWDSCYESIADGLKYLGFDPETRVWRNSYGHQGSEYNFEFDIDYGGFFRWRGSYEYNKEALKQIKADFGGEWGKELISYAEQLKKFQRRWFYRVKCSSGSQYPNNTKVYQAAWNNPAGAYDNDLPAEYEKEFDQIMRHIESWCLQILQNEWEYLTGEEYVLERFSEDNYWFDSFGNVVSWGEKDDDWEDIKQRPYLSRSLKSSMRAALKAGIEIPLTMRG